MGLIKILKQISQGGKKSPHPLISQNNKFSKNLKKDQLITECEFVVFDTELTGLSRKKDEVVAIGGVKIKDLQIQCGETFYALVKPEDQLYSQSTLIHRITPTELTEAQPMEEVLPKFIEFCGNAYLVGHYVRMDLEFVNKASERLLGGILKTPYLDTMRLAMAYNELKHGHYYDHYNISTSYNLTALCKQYELPSFEEHNALQDSLQTAYLFLFLAKKMRDFGAKTLGDFLKAGRQWKILP